MTEDIRIEVEHLTNPLADALVLTKGGWISYEITADMMTGADTFTVDVVPTRANLDWFRQPGHKLRIYHGDDLQMTGLVDVATINTGADKVSLELTGRDFGGLLVDASVDMIDLKGQTLRRLVESMIAPFSEYITELITDNAANRYKVSGKKLNQQTTAQQQLSPTSKEDLAAARRKDIAGIGTNSNYYQGVDSDHIDVWRTKAGEKVWDRIVWLAGQIGCIAWMTATGQLVVGRPLYNQQPSERFFVHINDEGNITDSNCLIRHGGPDISDRAASYAVVGQGGAAASVRGRSIADHHAEAVDLAPAFWIEDGGAFQNRIPLTDVSTIKRIGNAKLITRVARRRMEGNAVDSYDMVIDAPGHRNVSGGLRAVDTVVDVDWQPRRTLGPHYVRRRTFYNDGESGERTSLAVIPTEIWLGANTDNVSDAFYNLAMYQLWKQYGM